jgi:hypothetical protein
MSFVSTAVLAIASGVLRSKAGLAGNAEANASSWPGGKVEMGRGSGLLRDALTDRALLLLIPDIGVRNIDAGVAQRESLMLLCDEV